MSKIKDDVKKQIEKRRTFAIISHPDAGKTTLTAIWRSNQSGGKCKGKSNIKTCSF